MNNTSYQRMVGISAILAGGLSLACLVTGAVAVNFNFEAFSDPVLTLHYASSHALSRSFLLLDMFGYYLLLLPVIFYLHRKYKYSSPWNSLLTFSGAAYVFTGAIGAAILAAVWPELMKEYVVATGADKDVIAQLFKMVTQMVVAGLWNILETIFSGVWWMGTGILMIPEKKWLGVFTIITGCATMIDSIGNILELKALADMGMNIYLAGAVIWPIWIGNDLLRKNRKPCEIQRKAQEEIQEEDSK